MAQRSITVDGIEWSAAPSGRVTQYGKDEFAVIFTRYAAPVERRVARYSPLGAKRREASLAALSEAQLTDLFRHSQPSWTAPELGYR